MIEFLIILAIVWLAVASICDIRKREVPNWLNFSLIAFALAYRAFYSVIENDSKFFIYGVFQMWNENLSRRLMVRECITRLKTSDFEIEESQDATNLLAFR